MDFWVGVVIYCIVSLIIGCVMAGQQEPRLNRYIREFANEIQERTGAPGVRVRINSAQRIVTLTLFGGCNPGIRSFPADLLRSWHAGTAVPLLQSIDQHYGVKPAPYDTRVDAASPTSNR